MSARVLIVDDEANLRRMLEAVLAEEGFEVGTAAGPEDAQAQAAAFAPEVILLDLVLGPETSGLDLLETLQRERPGTPVIMMSGKATLADAVRATKLGAFQFLEKPLTPERVLTTTHAAADLARTRAENAALRARLTAEHPLVGSSAVLDEVRRLIARVAPTPSRVLVTGESGTGKELVARAIHAQSSRAAGPMIAVNCAAVPRELMESELFGHEKGAFTGATQRRDGKFALAHRGTLFLDEIGELAPDAQAKLLRVLETGSVERVGGSASRTVDVRVIAATNRDLEADVRAGRFREDLFFRLNVFPIHLPPLRDRPTDLPELVAHLAARTARQLNRPPRAFPQAALDRLAAYPWPGNVRELANVIERLAILEEGEVSTAEVTGALGHGPQALAPPEHPGQGPRAQGLSATLANYEKQLIEQALASSSSVAAAARLLQTDRANLYRRMKRLGLDDEDVSQ